MHDGAAGTAGRRRGGIVDVIGDPADAAVDVALELAAHGEGTELDIALSRFHIARLPGTFSAPN